MHLVLPASAHCDRQAATSEAPPLQSCCSGHAVAVVMPLQWTCRCSGRAAAVVVLLQWSCCCSGRAAAVVVPPQWSESQLASNATVCRLISSTSPKNASFNLTLFNRPWMPAVPVAWWWPSAAKPEALGTDQFQMLPQYATVCNSATYAAKRNTVTDTATMPTTS